jgi:hypothetical protein
MYKTHGSIMARYSGSAGVAIYLACIKISIVLEGKIRWEAQFDGGEIRDVQKFTEQKYSVMYNHTDS